MTCAQSHHTHCMTDAVRFAEQHCAKNGLRFTEQRRNVFQLLWNSHKALTASDIMDVIGRDQPPLTYRALDFLKEQKLIHHIASLNAYIGCIHPESAHVSQLFICETCRDVTEISADTAARALTATAQKSGFTMRQTFIEVLGLCRQCVV